MVRFTLEELLFRSSVSFVELEVCGCPIENREVLGTQCLSQERDCHCGWPPSGEQTAPQQLTQGSLPPSTPTPTETRLE
jgi:hypothetical protein